MLGRLDEIHTATPGTTRAPLRRWLDPDRAHELRLLPGAASRQRIDGVDAGDVESPGIDVDAQLADRPVAGGRRADAARGRRVRARRELRQRANRLAFLAAVGTPADIDSDLAARVGKRTLRDFATFVIRELAVDAALAAVP